MKASAPQTSTAAQGNAEGPALHGPSAVLQGDCLGTTLCLCPSQPTGMGYVMWGMGYSVGT